MLESRVPLPEEVSEVASSMIPESSIMFFFQGAAGQPMQAQLLAQVES